MLERRERADYQRVVARAFTGTGRGIAARVAERGARRATATRLRAAGVDPRAEPRDLDAGDWVALFRCLRA